MQNLKDLELLIKSSTPIIIIESREEGRVRNLFQILANKIFKPFYCWTITEGLKRQYPATSTSRHKQDHKPPYRNLKMVEFDYPPSGQGSDSYEKKPYELLNLIRITSVAGVYLLFDFHPYLEDPVLVRHLKDIARNHDEVPHTIVLISHSLNIPGDLDRYGTRFELTMPDREQLEKMIQVEAMVWSKQNHNARILVDKKILKRLVESLLGLPVDDVTHLVRGALHDGVLTESEIKQVNKVKFDLLSKDGVLSYELDTAHYAEVGGLERLKEWLEARKPSFTGELRVPGLDPPKGIMLLGVQGCGKSLAAKAVAGSWNVPLLRLDFGSIYNKFYGESEKNLRATLKSAETMAPCVLWIDEIEKGASTGELDGGTSRRILATLLTWMAEKKRKVFIVATANDIQALPPELIRKGRLDEIFFVDLPDQVTREEIFRIHLCKRELKPDGFDLAALAAHCEGFSGSEIEQAVVSSLYTAHARKSDLTQTLLLDELEKTRPLSVVMGEQIEGLRDWARNRTVPAN